MSTPTPEPMPRHLVTADFPPMSEEQFATLKASISTEGQLVPCLTWKGQLVDGVHRERVCIELGREPWYKELVADDEAAMVRHVYGLNLERRHLTESQRAVAALKLKDLLAAAARDKQKAAGVRGS